MNFVQKHNAAVRVMYGMKKAGSFINLGYKSIVESSIIGALMGLAFRPLYNKGGIWKGLAIGVTSVGGFAIGACKGVRDYHMFLHEQEQISEDEKEELWDEEEV